jgi:ABC-type nitrate/sulfonate/bicarbonate transport system substrate-binding protein
MFDVVGGQRARRGLKDIVLAGGALGLNWLPVHLAMSAGIFEANGLRVSLKRTGSAEKAIAAVKAGEADLAITPPEGAIADEVAGGALRILAGNVNRLPLSLIATPRFTRIEELKGKVLGTSTMTEGTAIYTREMLSRHGLNYPADYQLVVVGMHPARWKALQEGTIDAAVLPLNFVGEDAGYANLGELSDYIPDIVYTAIVGDRRWATTHREQITTLLAGLREATEFLYDSSSNALARSIVMDVAQTDEHYGQRALDYMREKRILARFLEVPSAARATTLDLMIKAGLLDASKRGLAAKTFDESIEATIAA